MAYSFISFLFLWRQYFHKYSPDGFRIWQKESKRIELSVKQKSCCQIDWIEMWAHWMEKMMPISSKVEWKNMTKTNGWHSFRLRASHKFKIEMRTDSNILRALRTIWRRAAFGSNYAKVQSQESVLATPLMFTFISFLFSRGISQYCNKCTIFTTAECNLKISTNEIFVRMPTQGQFLINCPPIEWQNSII